jgi:RNA polymerase sigma-70 factor (ECF subfamily)
MWGPRGRRARVEPPATLERLLRDVARGDDAAFEQLYDRMAPSVFGLVKRVLRDPAQSEEVTQEVFLEVWRSAPAYEPGRGSPSAWVLTMAHRRAVDRVRATQASRDRDDVVARRDAAVPYDVVGEEVEARLEQERVRDALASLTELQRQAVQLAFYGGYTHTEVSELLGVPLGTVKTRIRDGLIRLRDALGVTT